MLFISTSRLFSVVIPFLFVTLTAAAATGEGDNNVTVTSIESELEFDENKKLSGHYFVYPATQNPECVSPIHSGQKDESDDYFTSVGLEGEALRRVFPDYEEKEGDASEKDGDDPQQCLAACLEKGTDISVAGDTLPEFHYDSSETTFPSIVQFFRVKCKRVEVCFLNYATERNEVLPVYWIDKVRGGKRKQVELGWGEKKTHCFQSFLGHEFQVIVEDPNRPPFEERFTIEHVTSYAFGESPPSNSDRFESEEHLEREVKRALDMEWSKHFMVERTFSSLGFMKGRLPNDVFANMGAFYYNNRYGIVNEEWGGKGLFVNWWETDVKFLTIPWDMKRRWQVRLNTLVSEWAGVTIEETSMYGLRQYESGARLLNHVDRLPTHAVSLIVNVAQTGLSQPWPVEVFDHADRLHEVVMEPGDMVYYESAKNLHGRNRPLVCGENCAFVNLFTHYRPVDDGDRWHTNLNDMTNRPPPLLKGQVEFDSDEDSCQLPDHNDNSSASYYGAVKCADRTLGPNISPTRFTLNSADDLLQWWKSTRDPNVLNIEKKGTPTIDTITAPDIANGNSNGSKSENIRKLSADGVWSTTSASPTSGEEL